MQRTQTFRCTRCGNYFKVPIVRTFTKRDMTREAEPWWDVVWKAEYMQCPFRVFGDSRSQGKKLPGCGLTVEEVTGKGRGRRIRAIALSV